MYKEKYMKEIPLTRGMVAQVDDEDFEWLSRWKWRTQTWTGSFCAVRGINGVTVYMHREIMKTPKGMVVHHVDHNPLNNCKSNLRNCTQRENLHSQKEKDHYQGVSWCAPCKKYRAKIKNGDKHIHLGLFTNKVDAALAYNAAAVKYYGDFARLNKVSECHQRSTFQV